MGFDHLFFLAYYPIRNYSLIQVQWIKEWQIVLILKSISSEYHSQDLMMSWHLTWANFFLSVLIFLHKADQFIILIIYSILYTGSVILLLYPSDWVKQIMFLKGERLHHCSQCSGKSLRFLLTIALFPHVGPDRLHLDELGDSYYHEHLYWLVYRLFEFNFTLLDH